MGGRRYSKVTPASVIRNRSIMPRLALLLAVGGLVAGAQAADLDTAPAVPDRATVAPETEKPGEKERDELPVPQAQTPAQGESWWQAIVRAAPQCRVFSDGCRICNPAFSCSNLPIACQPGDWTCIDPKP